jgi:hypothetical protein
MIGDEIVQVIALRSESVGIIGKRAFNILGGIATVYRHTIDLTVNPRDNLNWLNELHYFIPEENPDRDLLNKIIVFKYGENNEQELINQLNYSLDLTKQLMLPKLDKVKNLEECMKFICKYSYGSSQFISIYESEDYGNSNLNNSYIDGLYIHRFFSAKQYIEFLCTLSEDSSDDESEEQKANAKNNIEKLYNRIKNLFENSSKINNVEIELAKRKIRNQEILKSYNLIKE